MATALAPQPDTQLVSPQHTDLSNALRFVADHGARTRYYTARGKRLVWDDNRWRWDDTEAVVASAQETVEAMVSDAMTENNQQQPLSSARHAINSGARANRRHALPGPSAPLSPRERPRQRSNAVRGSQRNARPSHVQTREDDDKSGTATFNPTNPKHVRLKHARPKRQRQIPKVTMCPEAA
jgi:hypothetical protein